jgi:hypothetical protein
MTLEQLRQLLDSGEFHHATYRNMGTLWEGLWIYRKSNDAIGFYPVGCFNVRDGLADLAHDMVRHTGVSVGSFGKG